MQKERKKERIQKQIRIEKQKDEIGVMILGAGGETEEEGMK